MPQSNKSGVYLILHKTSGTCYIGSAARRIYSRWGEHRYALHNNIHRNKHLQSAWNKYGEKAFAWMVLENVLSENVLEREQYWCDLYKEKGIRLYNQRFDVKSQLGMHHSDATKLIISKTHKGRIVSAETRAKISLIHKGVPKPSASKRFAKHWPTIVSPGGEPHTVYNLTQFCKDHGLDVSSLRKAVIGEHPHYKGWRLLGDGESPTPFSGNIHRYGAAHTITAPDGTIYTNVTNLSAFAREHGLSAVGLRQVAIGNYIHHHEWKVTCDGYEPKTVSNRHSRQWPEFVAPNGVSHPCANLYQFCKAHGLDKGAMQRLVKGQARTHKGWQLASYADGYRS